MTAFSSEQLNFFKFSAIVLDEFPVAVRQVFKYMWDNQVAPLPGFQIWDDSSLVRNMFLNNEGGRTKYVSTSKSYMEWDGTALFEATLYAKSFAMPDGRGGVATLDRLFVKPRRILSGAFHPSVLSPVGNQAETFALALDQLRLLRNNLCHQTSTQKIDKVTFDHLIQLAKDAFAALGQSSKNIDDIGRLGEKDFPVARLQELEEELRAEKFKQIRIELDIKDIGSDVKDVKTEVTDVKTKITEVQTNLGDFGADLQDVKAGITDMTMTMEDVASELERRETGMKEIMEEVRSYLKEVETEKQAVKAGISTGIFVPDSCIPDNILHFVGRQEELQRILDHLKNETTRVVNIWGSPGFGKTSVAVAAAQCLHHDLKIPVYFVPLRGMESMDELLSKLLSMFTDPTQVPHLSSAHWLVQSLQSQKHPFVLILDNADDLLESENSKLKQQVLRFIEEILVQCKHIKLLLTTRASLDFLRYHVQIHLEKINVLDEFSSVNLVKCLLPNVSDEDGDCIVNSCGRVPLAMQLMCGIIREESITITELLENLKRSPLVELLDNESFPDDVRLKTLMKKSFERLPDREKKAFVSLAVFPGWFRIEEATAVLDLEGDLITKSILRSLERKSLIECGTDFSLFTIHSLLRSFIYEERKNGNEIEAVFRSAEHRFYDYYVFNLSAVNEKFLKGPSIQAWSFFTDRRQSILSSLENALTDDRLYPKVVEVLSKAEILLFALLHKEKQLFEHLYDTALQEAKRRQSLDDGQKLLASKSFRHWGWFSSDSPQTWDDSSSADHTNRADRPAKLYCYQAIHQLLCGKIDEDISSLVDSVEQLSNSSDEYVLEHLTYSLLERHLQGKDNERASHFRTFSNIWFEDRLPGFNPSEEGVKVEYLRKTIREDLFFFMACSKLLNLPEDKQSQSGHFLLQLLNNSDTEIFTNLLMYSAKLPADIILLTYVLKDLNGAEEILQASELLLGKEEFSPFVKTVLLPFLKLIDQLLQSGCNFIQSYKSTKKLMEHLTCVSPKFPIPEYYSHLITEVIESILTANENAPGSDFIDLADSYDKLGEVKHLFNDDNHGAIVSHQQAISVRGKMTGDHINTVSSLTNVGCRYFELENADEADKAFQSALNLRERLGVYYDVGTADIYYTLGQSHYARGNYHKASESLQKASQLRLELLGNHPDTSASLHKLGCASMELGDNKSAVDAFLKAANMRSSLLGDHVQTAWSYEYLGLVQTRNGDLNGALKSRQKALQMRSKLLGDHEDTAQSYHNLGVVQYAMGDFHEALESVQKATQMNLKLFGDNKYTAQCYHTLGVVQDTMGDHKGALESLQKACRLRKDLLGDHPDTARSFHLLGDVQSRTKDLKGASDSLQKASRLRMELLGNHLDTSKSFHKLGRVYMNAGDNKSAVEAFLKAADMRSSLLGDHVQTAWSCEYLGLVQTRNGDLNGALKSHQKALQMRSKLLGDHEDTAQSYHNLGVVQYAMGDFHEALESVQKATQMNLKLFGDNKYTAQCYHTLGVVQDTMGDHKGALESLQKACRLRKDLLGDHPDTARSFHLLGDVQSRTKDLKGASDSLQKASRLRMELLGNHLDTSKSFHKLGRVYMNAGDNKSAVEAFLKAADMRSSLLGDHVQTAWSCEYLGLVQTRNGDLNGALKSHQKALQMRSKLLGDHEDTAQSYHNLGVVQYAMGDFHEALESVQKATQMNLKLFGDNKYTAQCYHTLGVVQDTMGDHKGALESLQKACRLRKNLLGDHPDTASSFHLLDEVQRKAGVLKGASDSLQKQSRETNWLWKPFFRK